MNWTVDYSDEAKRELAELDKSVANHVRKAIDKVSSNPLPQNEGGYGKSLGNKAGLDLSGLLKIKLVKDGIRVVYALKRVENKMFLFVISARSDNEVYKEAAKLRKKYDL